jgi:hypothetical protein
MSQQPEIMDVEGVVYVSSRARDYFIFQYLLPVVISLFADCCTCEMDRLLLACAVILMINLATTKLYYGKRLIIIDWSITIGGDPVISFDFPEQPVLNNKDTFTFTFLTILTSVYWLIESFVILSLSNFGYFIVFFTLFVLQVLNTGLYMQGYNEASKKWTEGARTTLLGNVEKFQELPEQVTIENQEKI